MTLQLKVGSLHCDVLINLRSLFSIKNHALRVVFIYYQPTLPTSSAKGANCLDELKMFLSQCIDIAMQLFPML